MRLVRRVHRLLASRPVVIFVGVVLIITSATELKQTVDDDLSQGRLKGEHGTLLYGVVLVLKGLTDLLEGVEDVSETKSGDDS